MTLHFCCFLSEKCAYDFCTFPLTQKTNCIKKKFISSKFLEGRADHNSILAICLRNKRSFHFYRSPLQPNTLISSFSTLVLLFLTNPDHYF